MPALSPGIRIKLAKPIIELMQAQFHLWNTHIVAQFPDKLAHRSTPICQFLVIGIAHILQLLALHQLQ